MSSFFQKSKNSLTRRFRSKDNNDYNDDNGDDTGLGSSWASPVSRSVPETLAERIRLSMTPPQLIEKALAARPRTVTPRGWLCAHCENMGLAFGSAQPERRAGKHGVTALVHHTTMTELLECASSCGMCCLLVACLVDRPYEVPMEKLFKLSMLSESRDKSTSITDEFPDLLVKELFGYGKRIKEVEVRLTVEAVPLRAYADEGDVAASKVLGRPVMATGGHPRTLSLAAAWVHECYHNHNECLRTREDPTLPTRVIDVGIFSTAEPRLILSRGMTGKWVALSHRWGNTEFLQTKSSNIEEMQRAIPMSSLPATFKDAVAVTRHLGIRYLWIDSICILQDSDEDWLAESALMPHTYANAYVTIAAAATKDCFGGMLGERGWVADSKPCELPVDGGAGKVYLDFAIDRNHPEDQVNYLRDRAWCFQESRLSYRLLTFDRLQMSFTCLRHGLYESQDPVEAVAREYKNPFLPWFQGTLAMDDFDGYRSAVKAWYNLIADYTPRDLTFANDKLVAISGIANVIGEFIGDDYYAGLWRNNLPQALLWSPYEEETLPNAPHVATIPPVSRAPSWAWPSIEGPISCFLCREALTEDTHATVIEVETVLAGPDPYGQVLGGFMRIQGLVQRGFCGPVLEEWPGQPQLCFLQFEDNDTDISHCIFDIGPPGDGQDMWCLQITLKYGLLLVQVEASENTYSRIGIFHLRYKGATGSEPDWFGGTKSMLITLV